MYIHIYVYVCKFINTLEDSDEVMFFFFNFIIIRIFFEI